MEAVPLHVRMNIRMQHDGAPPHYALCSRQVMDEIFVEKWIGRGGPVNAVCQRTRNGASIYHA